MTVLTETRHAAEFILSEASGSRSRENGTLALAQNLEAGTVVELDNSGELVLFEGTLGSFGSPDPGAIGILINDSDATAAALAVSYIARDAEVNVKLLTYNGTKAEVTDSLALLGVIARD